MAVEEQQIEDSSKVPSDSDLFEGEVRRNLSERDVFVGDEDFYRLLANSTPTAPAKRTVRTRRSAREPVRHQRFSTLQKVFVVGIIVIEAMLLYVVLKPLLWPINKIPAPLAIQKSPSALPVVDSQQVVQEQVQSPVPLFSSKQPLSLEVMVKLMVLITSFIRILHLVLLKSCSEISYS